MFALFCSHFWLIIAYEYPLPSLYSMTFRFSSFIVFLPVLFPCHSWTLTYRRSVIVHTWLNFSPFAYFFQLSQSGSSCVLYHRFLELPRSFLPYLPSLPSQTSFTSQPHTFTSLMLYFALRTRMEVEERWTFVVVNFVYVINKRAIYIRGIDLRKQERNQSMNEGNWRKIKATLDE